MGATKALCGARKMFPESVIKNGRCHCFPDHKDSYMLGSNSSPGILLIIRSSLRPGQRWVSSKSSAAPDNVLDTTKVAAVRYLDLVTWMVRGSGPICYDWLCQLQLEFPLQIKYDDWQPGEEYNRLRFLKWQYHSTLILTNSVYLWQTTRSWCWGFVFRRNEYEDLGKFNE